MTSRIVLHAGLVFVLLALGLEASRATDRIPARDDFGKTQLAAIQARYSATPDDCGGSDKPAYRCSGVLIRITGVGDFHSWNPSPLAVSVGGVSFSYLRADSNFPSLFYNALGGFILSAEETPAATFYPVVLCAFPLEAYSAEYRADKGCGMYTYGGVSYPSSRPCQLQNVHTAAQWLEHVKRESDPKGVEAYYYRQCGFTIGGIAASAPPFLASLKAQALLPTVAFPYNELILATWPQNVGARLAIEAFFYLPKTSQSLASAQRNQRDLLQTDGVAVPVISVALPSSRGGKTVFSYNPGEQAIEAPTLPATFDLPPTVPQASTGSLSLQDVLARKDIEVSVPALSSVPSGSTGYVRWVGTRTFYETPAQPITSDKPTVFFIPRGSVLATLGESVNVSFVVTDRTLAVERTSPVLTVTVEGADVSLPPPELASDRSYARIDYPGMESTDQIWVSYEGSDVYDTPFPKKTAAFNAGIPPSWLGSPDQVYYWVKRGTQVLVSLVATPTRGPWPIVPDAANGWLDLASLSADPVVTVAPWDGIATGQSAWLDVLAYFPDGSEQTTSLVQAKTVDDTILRDGLRATVSRDRLRRLPDGSAVFLRMRVAAQPSDLNRARAFPVTRLTLRNAPGPIVTKPLPRLVDARADGSVIPLEGILSRSALRGQLQARVVPWPGMLVGQRVWLRVRGRRVDGNESVINLASSYAVVAADLTNGLNRPVPLQQLDDFTDQSPLTLELKVGFENLADETRALRFPVNHMAYGK